MSDVNYPSSAIELRERALEAQREGRRAEAEELFQQAFEAGHPAAAHDLGLALFARDDDAGGEMWCRRAGEQGVPAGAFEVGYVEERRGNLSEAERWYRQAADSGHSGGALNLGGLLERRGEVSAAMDLYRRAWELGEHKAAFNLGKFYDDEGKGDLATAAEWYERAAERGNAAAAYNLGYVRLDQGDGAAQVEAWKRAADLKHPNAAYGLGVQFNRQGDMESAVAWLRRSVEDIGHADAAGMLAAHHERRGERDKARFWRELPHGLDAYSPQFEAFASERSAAAIHRQEVLQAALGGDGVQSNMDERTLTTGGRTYHGVTLLGSFSHLDKSWLWSWDNQHFGADHPAIEPLRAVREHGRLHDLPELTIGRLNLSGFPDPHQAASTLAIAAAALLGGNGVHSCGVNDGKGSSYFHLDDPRLPAAGYDAFTAQRVLMTAIEAFPSDPRRVVRGFLAHHGFEIEESPDVIEGRFPDGQRLAVAFTSDGLVKAISTESPVIAPDAPRLQHPADAPWHRPAARLARPAGRPKRADVPSAGRERRAAAASRAGDAGRRIPG